MIEMKYAELIFEDGTVNQINLGLAKQTDIYIVKPNSTGKGKLNYLTISSALLST
jgi:hypothetical protein